LVWTSVTSGSKPLFRSGALSTLIVAGGATAAVFGAQGLANPSWGGASALFGLVAAMYTAATGVTVTLGGPGGQAAKDNPAGTG
jgi:hypothetical protein